MKLEQGRPADCAGRLPKEVRVYDLLDQLGVDYQRIDHEAAMTMEACAAIDEVLDAVIRHFHEERGWQVLSVMEMMEISERECNDTSLDYCPPYKVVHTFEYEENTIVFYSYCHRFDGKQSTSYAVRVLKHNDDGTLSFDSGFADFVLSAPDGNENYYYFTNIYTSKGDKSISFLYLPKDTEKCIYVDGIKAEKVLVSIDNRQFYLCYAVSSRDTFLSNLFTPISDRHKIEVK